MRAQARDDEQGRDGGGVKRKQRGDDGAGHRNGQIGQEPDHSGDADDRQSGDARGIDGRGDKDDETPMAAGFRQGYAAKHAVRTWIAYPDRSNNRPAICSFEVNERCTRARARWRKSKSRRREARQPRPAGDVKIPIEKPKHS